LADGKSGVAYLTKNFLPGFPAVATAQIAPKIGQGQPPDSVLRVLQISSKLVHFRWSYSQTREHRQNAPYSESNIRLKPSFKPNKYALSAQDVSTEAV